MLTIFYLAAIPTEGVPQPSNEGTYLLVNKTLIERAAVLLLVVFRTGSIAGLDLAAADSGPVPAGERQSPRPAAP